MYIIVEKNEHRIIAMTNALDYLENGYPRLIKENVAFPSALVDVYNTEVPEEVSVEKWCYDGSSFYENENYVEPIEEVSEFERGYEQALLDLAELESIE